MVEVTTSGNGVMKRLREETLSLHQETEQGTFQKELMAGKLSRDSYADLLAQLLPVHRVLERHLRSLAQSQDSIRAVVREAQFQEENLLRDLRDLGREPDSAEPLEAARSLTAYIEKTAADDPVALLGIHYVFEGSKNGGRFIARAVGRAYDLGESGLHYLDPHGEQQRPLWQQFKTDMESLSLSPREKDAIVEAAQETFRGILRLHRELALRK